MSKGAMVERGQILDKTDGGYTVRSLDRDGIETPPIQPIDDKTYITDDVVYFFLFPDGTGRIICGV